MIPDARKATWSQRRLMNAFVLACWALLFWGLMATDRITLYLSTRTYWLAPVGAVLLTVATVGRLVWARSHHPEPLDRKQALPLLGLGLVALLILAMPPLTLGSYAAQRRTGGAPRGYASSSNADVESGEISFVDLFVAMRSREDTRVLAERAGTEVTWTGFVMRQPDQGADEFTLSRFMITCCPGDAVTVSAQVVNAPPGQVESDEWVTVTGSMYPLGREVILDSSDVTSVPRPKRPYLSP